MQPDDGAIVQSCLARCHAELARLLPDESIEVSYTSRCILIQHDRPVDSAALFNHLNNNRCRPVGCDLRFVQRAAKVK